MTVPGRMDMQRTTNRLTKEYLAHLSTFIVEQGYNEKKCEEEKRVCAVDSTDFSIRRFVR